MSPQYSINLDCISPSVSLSFSSPTQSLTHSRTLIHSSTALSPYPFLSLSITLTPSIPGMYSLPSHLSQSARDLILRLLVVDPMKRITIPGKLLDLLFHVLLCPPCLIFTLFSFVFFVSSLGIFSWYY